MNDPFFRAGSWPFLLWGPTPCNGASDGLVERLHFAHRSRKQAIWLHSSGLSNPSKVGRAARGRNSVTAGSSMGHGGEG